MKQKHNRSISTHVKKRTPVHTEKLLKDESIAGKLILIAALLSLIVVNSPIAGEFAAFWSTKLTLGIGSMSLMLDIRQWVNEGLMAFFFMAVGLEIKREFATGTLKSPRAAVLPIVAAAGGMAVPAAFYMLFASSSSAAQGWGIPVATDIAFAVAVLSLLGSRVPVSLKIFLLTLAIADDIGAIHIIALFYAQSIQYEYLVGALFIAIGVFALRRRLANRLIAICLLGGLLWIMTHLSGVHASIVGAFMGFLVPIAHSGSRVGVAEKIERIIAPFSAIIVVPLFALANAGFVVSSDIAASSQPALWGVIAGLMAGKVIGVTFASWLLVKIRVAQLPKGVHWRHIIGIGFIAGIGFTVSIFITELAFPGNQPLVSAAKLGIFIASIANALIGYGILHSVGDKA